MDVKEFFEKSLSFGLGLATYSKEKIEDLVEEMVRRGEKEHIFPYQENADVMFNSALAYELSVLKPLVEPLLRQVQYGTKEYIEAKRLLKFLQWFVPVEPTLIPDNSILREFIGGSILQDFKIWQNHSLNY